MGLIFVTFVLVGRGGVFDLLALAFRKVVPKRIRQEIGEDPSPPDPVTTQKEKAL